MSFLKKIISLFLFALVCHRAAAQPDSVETAEVARMIQLSEVIVRSDLNVAAFLQRIKDDTTFYKAFRNLRVLGFTSLNDIRMMNKRGKQIASLQSRTRQDYSGGCRTMEVESEKVTGDMYDRSGDFNYYTAELYSGLFFTDGKKCGENNIVKGVEMDVRSKSGLDKHKEQLKMLFFNPGKRIPGIPFIGNKINIFDPKVAALYDMSIDFEDFNGQRCYVFHINAREDLRAGEKDDIVIDKMTTWFHHETMEIVGRNYDMSFHAGAYSFDVSMEVVMTKFKDYLVPAVLRYKGNWKVIFKKRERGVFTATLFGFKDS